MSAEDGTPRSPSTHSSATCVVCRSIWHAVVALSDQGRRPPSLIEINDHLGKRYTGFGSLTNHIASLVGDEYLENRWRHRGLHVLRPIPPTPMADAATSH